MKNNNINLIAVVGIVLSFSVTALAEDSQVEKLNKEVSTREVIELVQNGNLKIIPDLFSQDYVDHTYPEGPMAGFSGVEVQVTQMHQIFRDMQITIDEITAAVDFVAVKNHASGIATKGPKAGQKVCTQDSTVFRLKDGKITEHWDQLQMLPSCEAN